MQKKFIVNFLTYCSFETGYGHLNRCKILSKKFSKQGNSVKIYIKNKTLDGILKDKDISLIENENDMRHSDLLIVDNYNFNNNYYRKLKKRFKNILLFDDFKFITPKFVDGIINYHPTFKNYKKKIGVKYFLGHKYLFLRKEFYKEKNIFDNNFIFSSFGSYDQHNQFNKILDIIFSIFKKKIIFVTKNKKKLLFGMKKKIRLISNPKNISKIMAKCSFAVSSSGTTAYELIKLKKKIICISFSDNQINIAKVLDKKNNLFYAGHYNQSRKSLYDKILKIKKKMNKRKTKFLEINSENTDRLYKDIIIWLDKRVNKEKTYDLKTVRKEYDFAARLTSTHEKAKWGSKKTMFGRYDYIKKSLPFTQSKNWLDIGCGQGNLQREILSKNKSLYCTGIELSKKLYKLSKKNKPKNFNIINSDFNKFKFSNKKYDIITCHGVMAKTNFNLSVLLYKMSKIAKKGCRVLLDFQNYNWNKFNRNNYRDPRLKWYDPIEIKNIVKKQKIFKIQKFKGYLPMKKKEVPLNNAICVFLHLKKEE